MVAVSGLESRGNQPLFFEAKEPSSKEPTRFQRLADWTEANEETLTKILVVFASCGVALAFISILIHSPVLFIGIAVPCIILSYCCGMGMQYLLSRATSQDKSNIEFRDSTAYFGDGGGGLFSLFSDLDRFP